MILCLGGKNSPLSPPSWNCKRGHQSHATQNFDHIQADFKYWAQVPWVVQTHPALECSLVLAACPSPTPRTPQALSCHLLQWPHTSTRLISGSGSAMEGASQPHFCLNPASRPCQVALLCPPVISPPFRTPSLALNCGRFYSRASAFSAPLAPSYILFTHRGHSIFFVLYNSGLCGPWWALAPILSPSRIFNLVFPTLSFLYGPTIQ